MVHKDKLKGKRIIIVSIITLGFWGLYYFMPGLMILYIRYFEFPKSTSIEPYIIPTTRQIKNTTLSSGQLETIKYGNVSIKSPWGAPIREKKNPEVGICQYWFSAGQWLAIRPNDGTSYTIYEQLQKGDYSLKPLLGKRRTAYGLIENILNVTPDNINFFVSRKELNNQLAKLQLKIIILPRCNKIYHLEATGLDVVEYYIDNDNKPPSVLLEISDTKGNFCMVFFRAPNLQNETENLISNITICEH